MEIILKQDIENLGYKNDIVTVRDGYGRNFLIPNGMAYLATPSSKKMLAEVVKQSAHKEEKLRKEAEDLMNKLNDTKIAVPTKVGENGKIFGSINAIQLAKVLKEKGFTVDRKTITIQGDAIKSVGNYKATAKLFKDVEATISFEVVAEE